MASADVRRVGRTDGKCKIIGGISLVSPPGEPVALAFTHNSHVRGGQTGFDAEKHLNWLLIRDVDQLNSVDGETHQSIQPKPSAGQSGLG